MAGGGRINTKPRKRTQLLVVSVANSRLEELLFRQSLIDSTTGRVQADRGVSRKVARP